MSVFDLFRKNPPQQQGQQPPQGQDGNNPHVTNNPTVPNSTNTPEQNPSASNPDPKSPNAEFADLWKMEPTQQNQAPNFRIDPKQLSQVTGNMDFSKSVSRDDLAKIVQGGEEAVGALVSVLNSVGREIFSTNAQFSSHMTEAGYNTAQQAINQGLPNLVKKQFTQNELFAANPKLRDPALQPLVMAIQSQITQKYPNASAGEVNGMVDKYFNDVVAKSFNKDGQGQSQNQSGPVANYDFSSFLQ